MDFETVYHVQKLEGIHEVLRRVTPGTPLLEYPRSKGKKLSPTKFLGLTMLVVEMAYVRGNGVKKNHSGNFKPIELSVIHVAWICVRVIHISFSAIE